MSDIARPDPTQIERIAIALLLAYVCALPISWSPLPLNMQWSDVLFVPLLLCTVASRPRVRFSHIDVLVLVLLASSVPSLVGTTDLRAGLVQIARALYLIAVYGAVATLTGRLITPARMARWLAMVTTAVVALCLVALAAYYTAGITLPRVGAAMPLPYLGSFYRLYGTFLSPEYLVNFLTFGMPLALLQMRRGEPIRSRLIWTGIVVAIVVAACCTAGHGIAGLVVSASVCFVRAVRHDRPVLAAAAVVATVGLVLIVNVLLIAAVRDVTVVASRNTAVENPRYPYAATDEQSGTPSVRAEVTYNVMAYWLLKRIALDAFWRAPWRGVGLGAFHGETRRAVAEGRLRSDYREHDPHSSWFGRLAETGLIGTSALAALWLAVLVQAFRLAARGGSQAEIAAALAAGLVGLLVNSMNVDAMNFRFIWLAFGTLRGMADRA